MAFNNYVSLIKGKLGAKTGEVAIEQAHTARGAEHPSLTKPTADGIAVDETAAHHGGAQDGGLGERTAAPGGYDLGDTATHERNIGDGVKVLPADGSGSFEQIVGRTEPMMGDQQASPHLISEVTFPDITDGARGTHNVKWDGPDFDATGNETGTGGQSYEVESFANSVSSLNADADAPTTLLGDLHQSGLVYSGESGGLIEIHEVPGHVDTGHHDLGHAQHGHDLALEHLHHVDLDL